MDSTEVRHVVCTPGVCGGRPRIDGSRIRVWDIHVWHELEAHSVEEIVTRFPQLSHADVYAALAYYWDHRIDIEQDMNDADTLADSLRVSTTSLLERKLETDENSDADSNPPR